MNWTRYNIVLMLQLPQVLDKTVLKHNLVANFEELKTSQFQNLPPIPDPTFPIILGNSQLLNVNISPISFNFDFAFKGDQDICAMITEKIHAINSIASSSIIGNYRIGIVITSNLSNLAVYKDLTKKRISIDLIPDWLETQFAIRIKKSVKIFDKDRIVNLWEKFIFDTDANLGSVVIDINTSINAFLDIQECNVETAWQSIKPLLEGCIDDLQR